MLIPPDRAGEEMWLLERAMRGDIVTHYQTERVRKDGSTVAVELTVSPVRDRRTQSIVGASTIARDTASRVAQARFAALVEHSGDAIVGVDAGMRVTAWNLAAERLYAIPAVEAVGRPAPELIAAAGVDGDAGDALRRALAGEVVRYDAERRLRDGGERVLSVTLAPIRNHAAEAIGAVAVIRDVTQARRAQDALTKAESHFRAAFEHAPTGIAIARVTAERIDGLTSANPALAQLTGYAVEELLDMDYEDLLHPDDRAAARQAMRWLLEGDTSHYVADRRYVHKSGDVVWVQVSAALYDSAAEHAEAVLQIQDVTERKRQERQLQHLADHDPLTGLYNRRRFLEELDWVAGYTERYGTCAAVLVLDVDNFKPINDTYGHPVGDELLCALGHALRSRSRESDMVARLGGDEFGVILPHASEHEAQAAAEAILEAVRHVGVDVGSRRLEVSTSIGLRTIAPGSGLTAADLLSEADMALYDAKETGRDRASVVGHGSGAPERVRARLAWSERIRHALTGEGFALYEQPIAAVASGRIDRSEVLIRMPSGNGKMTPPDVFLEVAQRFGQMQAIDRWVIERAIRLLAARHAAGYRMGLEVNLSGESLSDESVMDFIAAEVRNSPIDPTCLVFEVTETVAIGNFDRARQLAGMLSDLGCGLALDDFGSGFGSFYYLKHLPFDLVKIDGDFIRDLPASRTDQLTVEAIVRIAEGLGKSTVAEFVGDAETLALVERLGVDYAQGYHLGMPSPAAAEPAFLSAA